MLIGARSVAVSCKVRVADALGDAIGSVDVGLLCSFPFFRWASRAAARPWAQALSWARARTTGDQAAPASRCAHFAPRPVPRSNRAWSFAWSFPRPLTSGSTVRGSAKRDGHAALGRFTGHASRGPDALRVAPRTRLLRLMMHGAYTTREEDRLIGCWHSTCVSPCPSPCWEQAAAPHVRDESNGWPQRTLPRGNFASLSDTPLLLPWALHGCSLARASHRPHTTHNADKPWNQTEAPSQQDVPCGRGEWCSLAATRDTGKANTRCFCGIASTCSRDLGSASLQRRPMPCAGHPRHAPFRHGVATRCRARLFDVPRLAKQRSVPRGLPARNTCVSAN